MRVEEEGAEPPMGVLQLLATPALRRPLLIAAVLQLSQQLSGINGVSITAHLRGSSVTQPRPGPARHGPPLTRRRDAPRVRGHACVQLGATTTPCAPRALPACCQGKPERPRTGG